MKCDTWVFLGNLLRNSISIKIGQEYQALYMNTNIHFWSYIAQFFLEREIFRTKVVEEIKNRHFVFKNFFFFRKSCRLWVNVEKYCRAEQATDDSMVHAHCMLDTEGYTHTHTHTHTQCAILIAFLLQQWLHERALNFRLCTVPILFFRSTSTLCRCKIKYSTNLLIRCTGMSVWK